MLTQQLFVDRQGVFDSPVNAEQAPCTVHAFFSHCLAEATDRPETTPGTSA